MKQTQLHVKPAEKRNGMLFGCLLLIAFCLFNLAGYTQAPTIASFSPGTGPVGSSVTITGTNFNTTAANNIVFFGATQATVTAATSTSVTVTVPAEATYKYLSVTNIATNFTAYSETPFITTLGDGHVAFALPQNFSTGNSPAYVTICDIDGDGKADLIVANSADNTVSVLRNTSTPGTVSFASQVTFATGTRPVYVVAGDIDGDGKPDLAVANQGDNTVSVLLNTSAIGTVNFAAQVPFLSAAFGVSTSPGSLAIADMDGDGKPDLVVCNSGFSGSIGILLNSSTVGTVSFGQPSVFNAPHSEPDHIVVGDMDGDGKPDVAVNSDYSGELDIFRNTSTIGSANLVSQSMCCLSFTGITLGDIDGDGLPDLAGNNGTGFSVMLNNSTPGNIGFYGGTYYVSSANFYGQCSMGDIDGDGKVDVVGSDAISGGFSVQHNISTIGTANFSTPAYFDGQINSVNIGDIDGDGKPDLVATNYNNSNTGATVAVYRQIEPFIWLGADNEWVEPGNWSSGITPNSCSANAIIPAGLSNYPTLGNQNFAVDSLTMEAGTSVNLAGYSLQVCGPVAGPYTGTATITAGTISTAPAGYLDLDGTTAQTISGNLAVDALENDNAAGVTNTGNVTINKILLQEQGDLTNNGSITLASTASGDAYYDDFTSSTAGTYTGNLTVQRYVNNAADGYRDISAPVSGATVAQLASAFPVFGQNGVDCWYNYNPYPNVQIYNEALNNVGTANGNYYAGWVSYTGAGNILNAEQGVAIRTYQGAPYTFALTGTPNTGPQSVAVTNTPSGTPSADGWNFVGNPYPSPIDWVAAAALNTGTSGAYYVFHTTGEYTGSWGTVNASGVAAGISGLNRYISSGQGFFVQANTNSNFVLNNTVRTGTASGGFFAPGPLPGEVRLTLTNGVNGDEIVNYTSENATNGNDPGLDAEKIAAGSTVYISYKLEGIEYAINVINNISAETVLPLVISASDTGNYILNAVALNTPGYKAYLQDALLNTLSDLSAGSINLSLNGGQVYNNYSVVFSTIDTTTTGINNNIASATHIYGYGNTVYVNKGDNDNAVITITDILGQQIAAKQTSNTLSSIPLNQLATQYIIVKVTEGNNVTTAKIFITNE